MEAIIDHTQAKILNNLEELKRENLRLTRELRKLQLLQPSKSEHRDNENYDAEMLAEAQTANLEKDRLIEELKLKIDLVTADNKRLTLAGTLAAEKSSTASDKYTERKLLELEAMVKERHDVVDKLREANDLVKAELLAVRQDLTAAHAKIKTHEMVGAQVEKKSSDIIKKFEISETSFQQLITFISKCAAFGYVTSADFDRRLGGVSPIGFFILDPASREIEFTRKPTEYNVSSYPDGFVLRRLDGVELVISFPDAIETKARAVFWVECLRQVGFKIV